MDDTFVIDRNAPQVPLRVGDLIVDVEQVRSVQGKWNSRPVCNSNRHKMEEGVEQVASVTLSRSIGQLSSALADGLVPVIADHATEPDATKAKELQLCRNRLKASQVILRAGGFQL